MSLLAPGFVLSCSVLIFPFTLGSVSNQQLVVYNMKVLVKLIIAVRTFWFSIFPFLLCFPLRFPCLSSLFSSHVLCFSSAFSSFSFLPYHFPYLLFALHIIPLSFSLAHFPSFVLSLLSFCFSILFPNISWEHAGGQRSVTLSRGDAKFLDSM